MKLVKSISLTEDVIPIIQRMSAEGVNFSAWVCQKVREYHEEFDSDDISKLKEKLLFNDPMENWPEFEESKPSIASQLKSMSKEELEKVISDDECDETIKAFARVFLKRP